MKRAELYQLIADPEMLTEQTLPDLKQIVHDFPCFHAARMLYLKNLAVVEDLRLNVEIKKMAVHIPDRMKLFMLIEGQKPVKNLEKESSFEAIENFLSKTAETNEKSLIFEPTASVDYLQWLSTDNQKDNPSQTKFRHQELIDSFIENESGRITVKPVKPEPDSAEKMEEPELPDKSYFTETLAYVYIKQKRYEKALEIIRNLSLKYPEKNRYFADQIRFLEKLIIHTKK